MSMLVQRTEWMRQAALLAAECLVRLPADASPDHRLPHASESAAWQLLAQQAPDGNLSEWLMAALAAVERYPDAAAAFSILAEDQHLYLPTAASFARIAAAGLGVDYDSALAAALGESSLHAADLIERMDPAGTARPLAQQGLRLRAEHSGLLFGETWPEHAQDAQPRPEVVLSRRAAHAAAALARQTGAVWIRGQSRRLARQFALDLAGVMGLGAVFLAAHDGDTPHLAISDALTVIDLYDVSKPPPLPPRGRQRFAVIAPHRLEHPGFDAVDAPVPGQAELATLWTTVALPEIERDRLAGRFHLTLAELRAAQTEAQTLMAIRHPANGAPTPPASADVLADAIRNEGARRMGPSVTLVKSEVTLDDLVVRPQMRAQLDDAVSWHKHGAHVWSSMGFSRDSADARGLSLLFSGPPGGGKTFAARCLANALQLNLYRIDLSQVVSKYIGETEKALARIFDEAEAGHGILFFDEADSMFGKRSEVKDAHDRYANIEVGFLLQRMESYDGVMILATNLRANLDNAFLRRIRFLVDFPMPGRAERRLLWERNLPGPEWRDVDLDIDDLAERFRLSGGNIRNAAVAAAHLAAADHAPIGQSYMARALVRELEKSGLPRGEKDLGSFARYIENRA